MVRYLKNWRNWVLTALAAVAVICVIGDPVDGNIILSFAGSKAIALIAVYLFIHLYIYWTDKKKIDDVIKNVKEED